MNPPAMMVGLKYGICSASMQELHNRMKQNLVGDLYKYIIKDVLKYFLASGLTLWFFRVYAHEHAIKMPFGSGIKQYVAMLA